MSDLDPLSTIITLAILSKKKEGCKLSIYRNIIFIDDYTYFQGIKRFITNNSKYDIQYLLYPIEIACKLYLNNKIKNIITVFKMAQDGLRLLLRTYINHNIIIKWIEYYINIINFYIDKFNDSIISNNIIIRYGSTGCFNLGVVDKTLPDNNKIDNYIYIINKLIDSKIVPLEIHINNNDCF